MSSLLPADWSLTSATLDDLDAIMALEVQSFDPAFHESREVYRRRIVCFPEGALLARCDGVPVGCFFSEIWPIGAAAQAESFALGHDIADRHDPLSGTDLYVASMALAPSHRGGGLGYRFFEACLQQVLAEFSALTSVVLLVNEHWAPARCIYGRAGFVEEMRLDGFFQAVAGPVGQGVVMRRPVAD
ncbi:MAG TPA: GNAT family N-acetyltransferase [Rhodocyclaceae bacterium]|jgi:GNAT superfamily N-acetyltransferase|nr:GNAT family N-acetyltransferase [Rhodocyclaceae bacterium]